MEISVRALMNVVHGLLFGGFFLMMGWGGLMMLLRARMEERPSQLTARGMRLEHGYWVVAAAMGWAAVLTGTYLIYPWYRAVPVAGRRDLALYPKFRLLADPRTMYWHTAGMEWKEHIAFFAPMLMTAVAYLVWRYRGELRLEPKVRQAAVGFALVALLSTCAAGFLGAMIDKAAPVQGGRVVGFAGKAER